MVYWTKGESSRETIVEYEECDYQIMETWNRLPEKFRANIRRRDWQRALGDEWDKLTADEQNRYMETPAPSGKCFISKNEVRVLLKPKRWRKQLQVILSPTDPYVDPWSKRCILWEYRDPPQDWEVWTKPKRGQRRSARKT